MYHHWEGHFLVLPLLYPDGGGGAAPSPVDSNNIKMQTEDEGYLDKHYGGMRVMPLGKGHRWPGREGKDAAGAAGIQGGVP